MDPSLRHELREAVRLALGGDGPAAHLIAQAHESEPLANWIHAVVHRMEGDADNASYWYGRCGRALRPHLSTDMELQEIAAALAD